MKTTREAALKSCKDRLEHLEKAPSHHCGKRQRQRAIELEKVKIEALRPVSREQVEMVRGEWQACFEEWQNHRVEGEQCSKCGFQNYGPSNLYNFCPKCGAPMTDKAVDMVMERLETINNA